MTAESTATVTPLCCGHLSMDESVLVAGRYGNRITAPSIVFLIEAGETVLVDTSFGDVDLMAELHPTFDCRRRDGETLPAALERAGSSVDEVDTVVLSHLDWDHCYNLEHFADAEVLVQREELAYAISPYPTHADRYEAKSLGREPPWLRADVRAIEGKTEVCEGVTAFPTPGHTVGHQSVAVETDSGTVVVAADALATFDNLAGTETAPFVRGIAMDELAWWESARAVVERAESEEHVLPGHEWGIVDAEPPDEG